MDTETASLILAAVADVPRPLSHNVALLWLRAEPAASVSIAEWGRRWGWYHKKVRAFLNNQVATPGSGTPGDAEIMKWAQMYTERRQAAGHEIRNPMAYAAGIARQIRQRGGLSAEERAELPSAVQAQPSAAGPAPSNRESDADRLRQRLPAASDPTAATANITYIMDMLSRRRAAGG